MTEKKFALFDFDGVIADSFSTAYWTAKHYYPTLTEEEYRQMFDENIYVAFKKRDQIELSDEKREYHEIYQPHAREHVRIFDGMIEVIHSLSQTFSLSIISSSATPFIEELLASASLDTYFETIMGKDVHESKVEKMQMIFEKHGATADDCVYITDTLGDMHEAKEHGMGAIACSWGYQRRETLEKGIPFRIVDEPSQLPDAIAEYFSCETH